MPYFKRGSFPKDFDYKAVPSERWRRFLHLWGWYIPYGAGTQVNFNLWLKQKRENSRENRKVVLYRNEPGVKNQPREITLTHEWECHQVKGAEAPSNGAVEYRFGLPVEESSQIVVSVHGNQNDAVAFIVLGVIIGQLHNVIGWLFRLISR